MKIIKLDAFGVGAPTCLSNQQIWHVYLHVEHLGCSVGIPIIFTLASLCNVELNLFMLVVSTAYYILSIYSSKGPGVV
jgi:hypothetical protein